MSSSCKAIFALVIFAALLDSSAAAFRACNFNTTDSHRDARCQCPCQCPWVQTIPAVGVLCTNLPGHQSWSRSPFSKRQTTKCSVTGLIPLCRSTNGRFLVLPVCAACAAHELPLCAGCASRASQASESGEAQACALVANCWLVQADWNRTTEIDQLPPMVRDGLTPKPTLYTCHGAENCCFDGDGQETYPPSRKQTSNKQSIMWFRV